MNIQNDQIQELLSFNFTSSNWILLGVNISINIDLVPSIDMVSIQSSNKTVSVISFADNVFYTNLETQILHHIPGDSETQLILVIFVPFESHKEKIRETLLNINRHILVILSEADINAGSIMLGKSILNRKLISSAKDFSDLLLKKDEISVKKINLVTSNLKEIIGKTIILTRLNSCESLLNRFNLETQNIKKVMNLDLNTLTSLNIMNCTTEAIKSSFVFVERNTILDKRSMNFKNVEKSSVFEILNICTTKMGTRRLKQLMLNPLQDIDQINFRLKVLEIMHSYYNFTKQLRDALSKMPDFQSIAIKIEKYGNTGKESFVSLEDLMELKDGLVNLSENISTHFQLFKAKEKEYNQIINSSFTDHIKLLCTDSSKLLNLLNQCLVFDEKERKVKVNFSVDENLNKIRQQLDELWSKMNNIVQSANDEIKYAADNEKSTKKKSANKKAQGKISIIEYKDNYVMIANKSDSEVLNSNKDYKLAGSTKNNGYFTTNEMSQISKKIKNLNNEYLENSEKYLGKILKVVLSFLPTLESISYIISELDIYTAFTTIIKQSKHTYSKPSLTTSREINIQNGRHFILDQNEDLIVMNYNKQKSYFVPNDCCLDYKNRVMLITGVNMGGKSTYIRQVGLITYLAHIGMYVPADEGCVIPLTDRIITRVGADDNLLKGMSTFYKEMVEVSAMINIATENSLLLVDEIGRGTSTKDGKLLSAAILDKIATELNSFCLFATHFHELTNLSIKSVANYFIEYMVSPESGLYIKYKMIKGQSNTSLGMELIRSLGISNLEEVIASEEL